ncbi:MAG: GIDE domain-containing protein [Candidatus Berkiellales bacterium]
MNIPLFLAQPVNTSAIKMIPWVTFMVIMGCFILFLLFFFYQSYKYLLKARIVEDTATAKIRSAAQGYTELRGIQHPLSGQPLIASLTKRPCTWYAYTIEHYYSERWTLLEQRQSDQPFELHDDTGVCIIDPKGAQITTPCEDSWFGFARFPKGKPRTLIGRLIGSLGRYRYREWRMEEGMSLSAVGNFRTQENEKSYLGVHRLSGEGLTPRNPFILSAYDQAKVIRQYQTQSFCWFLAYIGLFALVVWILIARLY